MKRTSYHRHRYYVARQQRQLKLKPTGHSLCNILRRILTLQHALSHWQHSFMYLVRRLQSVMSRYEPVTLLLRQLRWLKAPQRVDFKLAVLHADVCMVWYPPISLMNSTWRWSLTLVNFIYGSATSSSLIARAFPPSVTGYFRLFPLAAGMVCLDQHFTLASLYISRES